MLNISKFIGFIFLLIGCISGNNEVNSDPQYDDGKLYTGAELTGAYIELLDGKNVGVVVNQTSVIGTTHLVDSLISAGHNLVKIFSPEHGFRGEADAGEKVVDGIDSKSKLPIISLYGKNKKPTTAQLEGIDVLVFDIQDVGVRFYTYISTLHYVMEAAAENDIPLIVLDRPNPNIHYVDGPVLDLKFQSFVGMHQVPVVYGMTIGEYAQMINGEMWMKDNVQCELTIVPCRNYERGFRYTLPVKPSPNLPNSISILHYPSLCFFEGTTLSIGRGTEFPFQVIGHPELSGPFKFTPVSTSGAKYPKHENETCLGLDLRKVLPTKDRLDISYLLQFYKEAEKKGVPFFNDNNFFDLLAGTDELKNMIIEGASLKEIRASWQNDLEDFKKIRGRYLIYE
ncbi:MAG: DUF1343 domain-containing protein [Saprospiraceae bacterium]|nr:DUF1343 domain-containing protein [Bacteroidia bacterium]NNE15576.1 DUF1343 domain-containing protein [Saprospiraceae bacterium]NNL90862.1 DUF1343 domain-containing protein [Saprospiraceae bacterium]